MADLYTDDATLIVALRGGDEAAFAWLLDTYSPRLTRLARTYVSTGAVADEVVQDTWLGVINGIDRFEHRSSLKTWIYQILMNIARTRGAREQRTIPFSSATRRGDRIDDDGDCAFPAHRFRAAGEEWAGWWAVPPEPWEPAERFDRSETMRRVRDAVASLPDAQRAVMTMRDIEGWTSDEVCASLGITATNQRVLLHRGRAKVRASLDDYFGSPER